MKIFPILLTSLLICGKPAAESSYIRINLLGYRPHHPKVAVWCSMTDQSLEEFSILDAATGTTVMAGRAGTPFGPYGPFKQTYRLDFSAFTSIGRFRVKAGETLSPEFTIGENVYAGAADFCLRYMRQQRSGFNPYLKDSCHTRDGYVLYGTKAGIKDSTHVDVVGGWHDASDYLQYSTTSANATWHMLAAWRDFPGAFADRKLANGLDGKNGRADVLDEATWGLDWLLKMHPAADVLFNQVADDRDHISMRLPGMDSQYGRGFERPVYFIDGEKQPRGKFMNNTTGTSSTAAKFSSAFALGAAIFSTSDASYANRLKEKSVTAFAFAKKKPGVTQTVSVRSPYIYAEDNWVDDMELAAASGGDPSEAMTYARQEPVTPWLGRDTASHYQWYPFINPGHYELARRLTGAGRDSVIGYYKKGIELVQAKASRNAFNRGVPFIWCSNNLTVAFAIQCYWYRALSGDAGFQSLEQATFDWLFGCNPWGTSMVYGLPAEGDTPVDPHSAFTHLKNFPIDGGLVDGPVYTRIYRNLIGIQLGHADAYAPFQSDLAVYHDDYGDYSTNEPTMDGTASLVYLLAAKHGEQTRVEIQHGAVVRGDRRKRTIALVFTGDEFTEGLPAIRETLKRGKVKAGFFFTGRLYANQRVGSLIHQLVKDGHYFGPHSQNHLLYNAWDDRDQLLVTRDSLIRDLAQNYERMKASGIATPTRLFIPPYEWWNDDVARWCAEAGIQLISCTPGIPTNADYTYPEMGASYKSSDAILKMLWEREAREGLGGGIILVHIGTDARRTDKLYDRLPKLIHDLRGKGYEFVRVDEIVQ